MRRAFLPAVLLAAGCQSAPAAPAPAASTSTSAPASAEPPGPWIEADAAAAEAPPQSVGAAHIMIAFKGALGAAKTVTRSRDEARKRAEEVHQKLLGHPDQFQELVKTYSDDDLSKPAGGRIGVFERNIMPQAFSDAAFALPLGGISAVVESPRGFHVIQRFK